MNKLTLRISVCQLNFAYISRQHRETSRTYSSDKGQPPPAGGKEPAGLPLLLERQQ